MSKEKEKFKDKREKREYLFVANHVFNKVLKDFQEKQPQFDEQNILDVEVDGLTFNDMFVLLYCFRALAGKEIDKVVNSYVNDEIKD